MTAKIILGSNIVLECEKDEVVSTCIKENTFANPEYASNEANGRSNWQTDEKIMTYRFEAGCLVLPRGYMRNLIGILKENEIAYVIDDKRISKACVYPELKGVELRNYQRNAVEDALHKDQGMVVSPTGSGKTFIGLEIIRQKGQKALIIVHRQELARQWQSVIKERLGLTVGFIGDGEWNVGEEITVALIQTLSSQEERTKGISLDFGLVLVDEGHHTPCDQFYTILGLMKAKHRYALSATPNRRDGLEEIIYRAIGPVIALIHSAEVQEAGGTVPASVRAIDTGFEPKAESWHEYLDQIGEDKDRNLLVIDLACQLEGATLVLVDRIAHAEQLSRMFTIRKINHVLAHGQLKKEARDGLMDRIKSSNITIGTTSLLGEGLDVSVWSNLVMASPISSEIKLLQAVGRIVRPGVGIHKERALIYDLRDDCGFSGASFKKRFEIYKKNKIWVEFSQDKKKAAQN